MKLDVSTIEGYENMTPEEKVAALEAFEYDDKSKEIEKLKNAVTKANSEAAEMKRQRNALQSEDERKRQEREDELESLKQKLAEMENEKIFTSNKSGLLALGYDEALAEDTAKALSEGNIKKMLENQRIFLEKHDKDYKAQLMSNGVPTPQTGGDNPTTTDYQKAIDEAKASNDMSMAATLIRQQFEAQKNNE